MLKTRTEIKIVVIFFCLTFLIHCEEKEMPGREYPRLRTLEVSDISDNGAKFNAEIFFRGSFKIISYGFVWSQDQNPRLENSDKKVIAVDLNSNGFSVEISTTLKPGIVYHVKAFIQTENYIVYGTEVEFLSLGSIAPLIISFYPDTATLGDTIILTGKNFSYKIEENKARFDSYESSVVSACDTVLKIVVPPSLNTRSSTISVEIFGNKRASDKPFILSKPVIDHFIPDRGTDFTVVIIYGTGFCVLTEYNIVKFGSYRAEVLNSSKNQLSVTTPVGINKSSVFISVSVAGHDTVSSEPFLIVPPKINDFQPMYGSLREKCTVKGRYFGSTRENVQVLFDNIPAVITNNCDTLIEVEIPKGLPLTGVKIKVIKAELESISEADFYFLPPIINSISPPKATKSKTVFISGSNFSPQAGDNSVTFNGINASISNNTKNTLTVTVPSEIIERATQVIAASGDYKTSSIDFEYVGADWSKLGYFPSSTRLGVASYIINNTLYLGLGKYAEWFSDIWSFDMVSCKWMRRADFPGDPRQLPVSFAINGKGYVGLGTYSGSYLNDFWEYDPATDSWTRIQDFPGTGRYLASSFIIDNKCYVGLGKAGINTFNDFYKYDPGTGQWTRITDFPGLNRAAASSFSIGNNGYVGLGGTVGDFSSDSQILKDFWKYSNITDTWVRLSDFPVSGRTCTASFSLNDRGYVGLGLRIDNHGLTHYKTIFEYDPQSDSWYESVLNQYGEGAYPMFFTWEGSAYMLFIERTNRDPSLEFEIFKPLN
jgi:N-acetylneuraminic acid mutarotase